MNNHLSQLSKNLIKNYFPYLLAIPFLFVACSSDPEAVTPVETKGKSTTVITGSISTTLEYEAEFMHSYSAAGKITGLNLNMGNIGQTESAVILTLSDLDNGSPFTSGTYNYTNDPNATAILIGYYIDPVDGYYINPDAGVVNKIVLKSITDKKITGEYELNLEAGTTGDKIKMVGTFEAVGETLGS